MSHLFPALSAVRTHSLRVVIGSFDYLLTSSCQEQFNISHFVCSWIRHPRITLLMAVCLDTGPDKACIILERFERSTLFHVLYKTQTEMHLPSRVNLLVDVAEGMTYLHNVSVVHGFLSSLSVFIDEKMRAKVGNLEYSQEIGKKAQFDQCHQVHENWKSPHQLLCKPASTACDVFRFVDSLL